MHEGGPDEPDQESAGRRKPGPARVSQRAQPGRRMQRKRHESRQADDRQQQPAAPDVGAKEEKRQHDAQRQGDRFGGRDQRGRLEREP